MASIARVLCRSLVAGHQIALSRLTSGIVRVRRLTDGSSGGPSWGSPDDNPLQFFTAKKLNVSDVESIDVRNAEGHFSHEFQSFGGMEIEEWLVNRLTQLGYKRPFEIQSRTLPLTLQGKDVIARALTGSGKTLAFALPIVQKLSDGDSRDGPRAIVIAPTRELCNQVHQAISQISDKLHCVALYGGAPYETQEREIRRQPDVICATPGRLNDHIERGNVPLKNVQILILDEADELFAPNFYKQIKGILEDTPGDKQMMLFSATMPRQIQQVTKKYMHNAEMINLASEKVMPSGVIHQAMQVQFRHQLDIVTDTLRIYQSERAIVFTPTKAMATELATKLATVGINAEPLHSDLSQRLRENCLHRFRQGRINTLVATDVAARGLDVPEIDLVVQVGPPPNGTDYYIHRTGRTGRAGRPGRAILIHSRDRQHLDFVDEVSQLVDVERMQPPSYRQVTESAIKSAVQQVKQFDQELAGLAATDADSLQVEMGPSALSAALAIIANVKAKRVASDRPPYAFQDRSLNRGRRQDQFSYHSRTQPRYGRRAPEKRWGEQRQVDSGYKQWSRNKKY